MIFQVGCRDRHVALHGGANPHNAATTAMGGVSDADTWQGSPKERVARIDHSHRFFRRRHDELNRGSELVGFSRDPVLMEALGPVLSTCYLAVKRAEIAFCQERSPHEVALAYFTKY